MESINIDTSIQQTKKETLTKKDTADSLWNEYTNNEITWEVYSNLRTVLYENEKKIQDERDQLHEKWKYGRIMRGLPPYLPNDENINESEEDEYEAEEFQRSCEENSLWEWYLKGVMTKEQYMKQRQKLTPEVFLSKFASSESRNDP